MSQKVSDKKKKNSYMKFDAWEFSVYHHTGDGTSRMEKRIEQNNYSKNVFVIIIFLLLLRG